MVGAGQIIGRPVLVREGGREAGRIKDIVVDQPGKRVLGFIISEGFLRPTRIAPWEGLQAVGPDAVVLTGAADIVKLEEAPAIKEALEGETHIRGLKVQTTAGKELGRIEDFMFDELTGEVEGYELSGGRLPDAFGGRSFLPTPETIELGRDVAFVDPEVEAGIGPYPGGFKRVFAKPGF